MRSPLHSVHFGPGVVVSFAGRREPSTSWSRTSHRDVSVEELDDGSIVFRDRDNHEARVSKLAIAWRTRGGSP